MNDTTHRIAIGFGAFIVLTLLMCVIAKVMISGKEDAGTSKQPAVEKTAVSTNEKTAKGPVAEKSGTESADAGDAGQTGTEPAGDKASENAAGSEASDALPSGNEAGQIAPSEDTAGVPDTSPSRPDVNDDEPAQSADASDNRADEPEICPQEDEDTEEPAVYVRTPDSEIEAIDRPADGRKVVCINAGHQSKPDPTLEPLGPGSSKTKESVTWGADGATSGIREYKYTLEIALKLRAELEARGYYVYMIRETNDVRISDVTRARMANLNADIVIHIHANASDDHTQRGIMAFYPSEDNPYSSKYSAECKKLATAIVRGAQQTTGMISKGAIDLDDLSTLNWTTIPATHFEAGFLSTPEEEAIMLTEEYKSNLAAGIADGVDIYFGN